jgi:predicted Zn-dependent peptidase
MQKQKLENGITIIAHTIPRLNHAVVNVFLKIGSANEVKEKTGLAHFLEHMMFEGSKNYPDFDRRLQELRGENNAFTSQDMTNYYEIIQNEHIDQVLDIEADRFQNLSLKKNKFILQQQVIIEEFKETSINPPLSDVWHILLRVCYADSYQWPVIGLKVKHIADFEVKDVREFYQQNYVASNMIATVISSKPESEILKSMASKLSNIVPGKEVAAMDSKRSYGKRKIVQRRNISSEHLFIAIHIPDFGHDDYFYADLVSDLLANGDSSILYQQLVMDSNFCTEVQAYTTENRQNNLLIIECKSSPGIVYSQVLEAIENTFSSLRSERISDKQFAMVLNKSQTFWTFKLYNNAELAYYLSLFDSVGLEAPLEYLKELFPRLQSQELDEQIKLLLNLNRANIVVYQPKS